MSICRKRQISNDLSGLIQRPAEKELDALEKSVHKRIATRLLALEEEPRPAGVKKLQGQESYRLRVGDYRILYTIDDKSKKVCVVAVGRRREVYR